MSHSDDFDFNAVKKERQVYSIHLDKGRLAVISLVILFLISGTFFIGLFVGESKEKVYDSSTYRLSEANPPVNRNNPSTDPNLSMNLDDKTEKSYGVDLVEPQKGQTNPVQSNIAQSKLANEKNLVSKHSMDNGSDELKAFGPEKRIKSVSNTNSLSMNDENKIEKKTKRHSKKSDVVAASHRDQSLMEKKNSAAKKHQKNNSDKNKSFAAISGYQIQIASFSELKRARFIKSKLAQKGIKGHISIKETDNGDKNYRVTVGAGKKISELEKQLKELRKNDLYKSSYIVKM